MMPTLPLEILDLVICLLREDIPSLTACTSTGRSLVPICRAQLWRDVHVELSGGDVSHVPRTAAFLDLLDSSPAIRLCVRSLTLHDCPNDHLFIPSARACWRILTNQLPVLRSLRLRNFSVGCLYDIVAVVYDHPTLEALYLESVRVSAGTGYSPVWPAAAREPCRQPSTDGAVAVQARSRLHTLSTVGTLAPCAELSQLLSFLERSTSRISLQSLDLHWRVLGPTAYHDPMHRVRPEVPSFAETLRHFGITLSDMGREHNIVPEGRDHMRRVMASLPKCRALQSLCLEYDRLCYCHLSPSDAQSANWHLNATSGYNTQAPVFLDLLAETLSGPRAAALPSLQHLTLVFRCPPRWLHVVGFEAGLGRLAEALVGDVQDAHVDGGGSRRYPHFRRLTVRTCALKAVRSFFRDRYGEECEKQNADMENLVLPMLDRFVQAGVQVETICE